MSRKPMRNVFFSLVSVPFVFALVTPACGSSATGFDTDGGGGGSGGHGGSGGGGGSGGISLTDSGSGEGATDGNVSATTTVYANTDTTLYSLDPMSNNVTVLGTFQGMGGSEYDSTVTDCAVDAEGDVYVNTETVVYKATLPAVGGMVSLTKVAAIATASKDQSFYALAFAPKGFLGSGETLLGGDNTGDIWAINTATGAVQDLGNFGGVPSSDKIFALSGDMVFYTDASGKPTGLATIRACETGGKDCTSDDDYLAGIDMTALANAYTSGSPAASLLGGIYGGSSSSAGSGTGYGDVFGLGAWEGNVYGFTRAASSNPPNLISINTTTGAGSIISSSFGFTADGWSGAGVTTTTTITIPPPPPPPK
jgi:hypothetical protein